MRATLCAMETIATAQSPLHLVVVEDSTSDFELLLLRLKAMGWHTRLTRVETGEELRAALTATCAAVISDHQLPGFGSLEALAIVREFDRYLPFLVVSGTIGQEVAVATMRAGADDYIMKDDLGRLTPSLQRALGVAATRRRQREAEAELAESEARFRALAANLPGIVFQLQGKGNALALVYVNEGSRRLFGIAPGDIMTNPDLLLDRLAPEPWEDMVTVLAAEQTPNAYVNWVRHIDPRPNAGAEWIEVAARARMLPSGVRIWDCVAYDVTPQKRAEEELVQSREELRDLASHLTRVREQERESIARDIHDDVGSTLNAVKFDVAWLKGQLRGQTVVEAKLADTDQLVDHAIHAATRIMHDLRPGILDEGIVPALEWQARSFERRMGVSCGFASSHEDIVVEPDCAIAVFRICQEALNNVAKHAKASAVMVTLVATDERLDLEVRDNGIGVAPDHMRRMDRFGLRGMRERAASLGGELNVAAHENGGTSILLWLPRTRGAAASDESAA